MSQLTLIATHDQMVHAISVYLRQDGTDPLLAAAVDAVLDVHVSCPSPTGRPDQDCTWCHGTGSHTPDDGGDLEHCDCRCPWCAGCDTPLCGGPCPTVAVLAVALDIHGALIVGDAA